MWEGQEKDELGEAEHHGQLGEWRNQAKVLLSIAKPLFLEEAQS